MSIHHRCPRYGRRCVGSWRGPGSRRGSRRGSSRTPTLVPDPATMLLIGTAAAAAVAGRRRWRAQPRAAGCVSWRSSASRPLARRGSSFSRS